MCDTEYQEVVKILAELQEENRIHERDSLHFDTTVMYLTVKEAARECKINRRVIWDAIRRGDLVAVKYACTESTRSGSRYLIHPDDFKVFLEKRKML